MKFVITLGVIFLLSSCGIDDTIDGNDGDSGSSSGWEKEWSSESVDSLYSIGISSDNTIYVAGKTNGNLYSELSTKYDAFLAVFNPKGEELWGKQWATFDDDNEIKGLAIDKEGNIFVGGGGWNSFVMKFSSDGTKIWEKFPGVDSILGLTLDNSGNIYAGTMYGDILKFSSNGDEKIIYNNFSNEHGETSVFALTIDSEGNLFAGGMTQVDLFTENNGETDAFLVKIAPDGTHIWEKQWGSETYDRLYALAIDNEDNVYVAGGTHGTTEILLKFSSDGKKIWGNGGTGINYQSLALDSENNIYVGVGENHNLVDKYSSNGEKIWSSDDEVKWDWGATGAALDSNGNLYVCGGTSKNHLIKIPASEMR